jgi:hypothetical protein
MTKGFRAVRPVSVVMTGSLRRTFYAVKDRNGDFHAALAWKDIGPYSRNLEGMAAGDGVQEVRPQ